MANIRSHDIQAYRLRGWHKSVWNHVHVLSRLVIHCARHFISLTGLIWSESSGHCTDKAACRFEIPPGKHPFGSPAPLRTGAREGVMQARDIRSDQNLLVRCKYPKTQAASERFFMVPTIHNLPDVRNVQPYSGLIADSLLQASSDHMLT